jgi:hypothetical protein
MVLMIVTVGVAIPLTAKFCEDGDGSDDCVVIEYGDDVFDNVDGDK